MGRAGGAAVAAMLCAGVAQAQETGWDGPLVCEAEGKPVSHETITHRNHYVVPGATATTAMIGLSKPNVASSPTGDEVGFFDHSYELRVALTEAQDGEKRVARACVRSEFVTVIPRFDRRLQSCARRFTDHVEDHEDRHVAITHGVIDTAAHDLIGSTMADARARLTSVDDEIVAANLVFHDTDGGGMPPPSADPRRRCRGDKR